MTTLLAVISVVASILQIILFFKIWGMTNDVKRLADKFCPKQQQGIELYSEVKRIFDGKILIVTKIENGKYTCIEKGTNKTAETVTIDEITTDIKG